MHKILFACLLVCLLPVFCFAPVSELGLISQITGIACRIYGADRNHVDAIFAEESGFKNVVVYEKKICKNSYGPGCLLYSTAVSEGFDGKEVDLKNLETSIPITVKFIQTLSAAYHGDWVKIMSHYRTGKAGYKNYVVNHNKIYQAFKIKNP